MSKMIYYMFTLLLCCLLGVATGTPTEAFAAEEYVTAYVSIADETGVLVMAHREIAVTDVDADGAVTLYDCLYCAHEIGYSGGAAAGFRAEKTVYGLSMMKLWGFENGGSCGYYVNHASAYSLADVIKDGDFVYVYNYQDLTAWSDRYSYFDKNSATVAVEDTLSITLSAVGFDAAWNPVVTPESGATLTVNGEPASILTDTDGKAEITFETPGTYVLSAVAANGIICPPVYVVTVEEPLLILPQTGTTAAVVFVGCGVFMLLLGSFMLFNRSTKSEGFH